MSFSPLTEIQSSNLNAEKDICLSSLNHRGHVNRHVCRRDYMIIAIISRYRLICCKSRQDPPPPLLQCSYCKGHVHARVRSICEA